MSVKIRKIFKTVGKIAGYVIEDNIKFCGEIVGSIYDLRDEEEKSFKVRKVSRNIASYSSATAEFVFETVGLITDYTVLGGIDLVKAIKKHAYVKTSYKEGNVEEGKIVEAKSYKVIE